MTPQELIKNTTELAAMPGVYSRISEMVNDDRYSAMDIGQVISHEPSLTIKLLKIANSALYGFTAEIDTVSRAVVVLGSKTIRDLVMATSTIKAFDGLSNHLISQENFWRHSLACGLAARALLAQPGSVTSTSQRTEQVESLFIAGVLHDVGQLVIFNQCPQQSIEVLTLLENDLNDMSMLEAEQQVLGFDHAQVGAELIKQWQLPEILYECVAFHHQPAAAVAFKYEVAIIHIANVLAVMAELNETNSDEAELPPLLSQAWDIVGLSDEVVVPVVAAVKDQLEEVSAQFLG